MPHSTPSHPRATLTVSTSEGEEMMSMAVSTLPIDQAAKVLGFSPKLIEHLVAAGVIAGDKTNCNLDEAAQIAARLRAAQAPVEGHPILVSEAVKKYGFHRHSIYNWIEGGWVKVIEPEPRIRVNEGNIALAHALAEMVGHVPGRAIFPAKPRSGRPSKKAA